MRPSACFYFVYHVLVPFARFSLILFCVFNYQLSDGDDFCIGIQIIEQLCLI